ncbi:MAG: hypothetical protein II816_04045, partial [Elusimicrobia bacterium]|nr:hypothetical protein [Elusimicrobiota bacterium]
DNLHGVSNTTDKLFMYKNQVLRLRTGCTVKFTYRAYANSRTINGSTSKFYGSTELIVEARWPTEYEDTSAEKAKSMNKISLGTFVAQNWAH